MHGGKGHPNWSIGVRGTASESQHPRPLEEQWGKKTPGQTRSLLPFSFPPLGLGLPALLQSLGGFWNRRARGTIHACVQQVQITMQTLCQEGKRT